MPARALPYWLTLIVLNATLGLIRLLESKHRTQSPAFHYAKQILPMHWWGVVFLTVAAVIVVARGSVIATQVAASFGCGIWLFWAVLLAVTAFRDGRTSYAGAVLYTAGAVRHYQVVKGG